MKANLSPEELRELMQPPVVSIEELPADISWQEGSGTLWERIEKGKELDLAPAYHTALEAEDFRQYHWFSRLLSKGSTEGADLSSLTSDVIRRVMKTLHGRVLLSHTSGFESQKELGLLINEYLERGLSRRCLFLVPAYSLGFWQTELLHRFNLRFECHKSLPEKPASYMLLPFEALQEPLSEQFMQEAGYQLIVVENAGVLRKRRSRLWKNLLAFSPDYLILQEALPIHDNPVEAHGLLALLGAPDLPPPSILQKELGGEDAPISPSTRNYLRPFFESVLIRNTLEVYPQPEVSRVWEDIESIGFPASKKLRLRVHKWIQGFEQETPEKPALCTLLKALSASPIAFAEQLSSLQEEGSLVEHVEEMKAFEKDARALEKSDPRLEGLFQLLQQQSKTRILIFCQHKATIRSIRSFLKLRKVETDFVEAMESTNARVVFATDDSLPNHHSVDMIVHYDIPWCPAVIERRAFWLRDLYEGDNRQNCFLLIPRSFEAEFFRILRFRSKVKKLKPGELSLLTSFWPGQDGDSTLWSFARSENDEDFFEALSHELLEARKRYRQVLDRNQRLFLDDYTI